MLRATLTKAFGAGKVATTDVVIIGAGVIGAATAMELTRKGVRTISVDQMPSAGMGTTSFSSAISRMHYSVLDGVKMSWEGFHVRRYG